jgi:hypothetical protein
MKIAELLAEVVVSSVVRKTPREILISNNWNKSWQKAREGFAGVDDELKQFYLDKIWFDPPLAYGKKDGPVGTNLAKLKGMGHAHMHFGKLVIIYKVDGQTLRMYLASDHKTVEKGGLTKLGELVDSLHNKTWTAIEAPAREVQSDVHEDPELEQAVTEWLELMDSDPDTYKALRRFAQDSKNYWQLAPYAGLDDRLSKLTVEALHKKVVAHKQ